MQRIAVPARGLVKGRFLGKVANTRAISVEV